MLRQSQRRKRAFCNLGTIYYAMCCCPDAALVIHAPRACSHWVAWAGFNARRVNYLRQAPFPVPERPHLFVSGMGEKQAIFGGEQLLKKCLRTVAALPYIHYIVVAAGCTASVIGDDTESVCRAVEAECGKPILFIPGTGFMTKNYVVTQSLLLDALFRRFAPAGAEVTGEKVAVVLGENPPLGNLRGPNEVARLLRYFGFTRVLFPPNGFTCGELAQVAQAKLILPTGINKTYFKHWVAFGEKLAARYGAHCSTLNFPDGLTHTYEWLRALGAELGMLDAAERAVQQEQARWRAFAQGHRARLAGKRCLFVISHRLDFCDPVLSLELFQDLGIQVTAVVLHNDLKDVEKAEQRAHLQGRTTAPVLDERELAPGQDIVTLSAQADFMLTTVLVPGVARQLSLSIHRVGIGGAEYFVGRLERVLQAGGHCILHEY